MIGMTSRWSAVVAAAVAGFLVGCCGPAGPPDGASPVATQSSPTPSPGSARPTSPAFPADILPDTGSASGSTVGTVVDLRVGAHLGYDRVVVELAGPGTPSWQVRYVEETIADASGLPVDVSGAAVLEVTLFPVDYPLSGGYSGPDVVTAEGVVAVTELVVSSLFEGYQQLFIGVSERPRPFRAFALSDPARIVVDVRTD